MTINYAALALTAAERAVMPANVATIEQPDARAEQEYLWLVSNHFRTGHCPLTPPNAYRQPGDALDIVAREEGHRGLGFGHFPAPRGPYAGQLTYLAQVTRADGSVELWDDTEQAAHIIAHIRRCPAGI